MATITTDQLATDKQNRYIESLVRQINFDQPELVSEILDGIAGITKRDASKLIDKLIPTARAAQERAARRIDQSADTGTYTPAKRDANEVPAGRYALAGERTDGEVEFFQVRYGKSGKWAGFLFLDRLVGAPMDGRAIPVKNRTDKQEVLADISADIQGAAARFGREIGHCGFCAALLTDERSRAAGYGSTCAANHSLPY